MCRRLPWSRGAQDEAQYRRATSSPDSQYGFSSREQEVASQAPGPAQQAYVLPPPQAAFVGTDPTGQQYYLWGPPPPYTTPPQHSPAHLVPLHHHHCAMRPRRSDDNKPGDDYVNAAEAERVAVEPMSVQTPVTLVAAPKKVKKRGGGGAEIGASSARSAVEQQRASEAPESEVYFADVSSCCNEGQDLYDEAELTSKCFSYQRGPSGQEQLPKEQSAHSLALSSPGTELTDLSAMQTPVADQLPFHRALAPDAQYETIPQPRFPGSSAPHQHYEPECESESAQPPSNCYSDATMDSGCHSGSEFAPRRRPGSLRVAAPALTKEPAEPVPAIRSVNV